MMKRPLIDLVLLRGRNELLCGTESTDIHNRDH